jgi:hypothetical protein
MAVSASVSFPFSSKHMYLGELPPLWRSSSVATGPDFECNEAVKAEQARTGGKVSSSALTSQELLLLSLFGLCTWLRCRFHIFSSITSSCNPCDLFFTARTA